MKSVCKTCEFMKLLGQAKITKNNLHLKGPRAYCVCKHPEAISTFYKVCPKSPRMAGFIGYTFPGEKEPIIQTSPRWCPKRKNTKKVNE